MYQVAFSNALDRLSAAEQKIGELEEEKEGIVKDY